MVSFTACQEKETETTTPAEEPIVEEVHGEMKMNVQVGDHTFTATLEDNEAADELIAMMEDLSLIHIYSGGCNGCRCYFRFLWADVRIQGTAYNGHS